MQTSLKHLATALALLLGSTAIAAAATTPGTLISNSIDLSYTSGGNTVSVPTAATATFTVDKKIDLVFNGLDAGGVVLAERSQNVATLSYMLENKGNDVSGYDINVVASDVLDLVYAPAGGGAEGTFHVVISDNPVPGAGTEVIYNTTGNVNAGDLAPGAKLYVHVYANIKDSASDKDQKLFEVTATALDAGTTTPTVELRGQGLAAVDTVFADPGVNGWEKAAETLKVEAPTLTAVKTVEVISENLDGTFNCSAGAKQPAAEAAIPGGCVEYTISVVNSASASKAAVNLSISDELPDDVTWVSNTTGTFDSVTKSGDTLTGTKASLAPGETAEFKIRALIGS
ncbi:DUF11 domain-containing protein [Cereibacter sphaeroides]|uniref:DUF11 domain-containing protein n=1 Tax=Cereibacter sphaeroides TaxID=1063 RepID=UPI001F163CD9|nr:DUF11 domain-containing protein [Cereibacter sphaeroides]MCE6958767.1 DUF11 domain-containing protein [Cereibacter sphaeroides]MCE6973359.1 DUF11 domain-containing protein [Cereibacter sphaeroides]